MNDAARVVATDDLIWVDGEGAKWTTIVAKISARLLHGGAAALIGPLPLVPYDRLTSSRDLVHTAAESFPFADGAALFLGGGPMSFAIESGPPGGKGRRFDVEEGAAIGPSMSAPSRKVLAPAPPFRDDRAELVVPSSVSGRYFLAAGDDRWLDGLVGDERVRLETRERTIVGTLPGVALVAQVPTESGALRSVLLTFDMLLVDGASAIVNLVGRVALRTRLTSFSVAIEPLESLGITDRGDARPRGAVAAADIDPDATNVLSLAGIEALRKMVAPPAPSHPHPPGPAIGRHLHAPTEVVDFASMPAVAAPQAALRAPLDEMETAALTPEAVAALKNAAAIPFPSSAAPSPSPGRRSASTAATPFEAGFRPAAVQPAADADETLLPISAGNAARVGREVEAWLADSRKAAPPQPVVVDAARPIVGPLGAMGDEATVAADEQGGESHRPSVGILLSPPAPVPPPRLDPTHVEPQRAAVPIVVGPTRVSEPDMLAASSLPSPVSPPPVIEVVAADPARAALLARIDAKERLTDAKLEGQDLRGLVLTDVWLDGADLSRADLRGVDLRNARLDRARLDEARLDDANLEGASLDGASLRKARLDGARLARASLAGASFEGASGVGACFDEVTGARIGLAGASLAKSTWREAMLTELSADRVDLTGASLDGAVMTGARAPGASLSGAKLARTDLSRADLTGALLRDVEGVEVGLSGASLEKADLSGASLAKAHLAGAKLGRSKIDGAQLDGARLRQADLRNASALRTSFDDASLDGAVLREIRAAGATFQRAVLDGADFERAEIAGARFDDADARRAKLRMAKLPGASFARARLGDADLRDADLTGADLTGAETTGARFRGAKLKDAKGASPDLAKNR